MVWFMWAIPCIFVLYVVNWIVRGLKISDYKSKHVFISGCDFGIGLFLTQKLDEMGFIVHAGCLTDAGKDSVRHFCSERTNCVPIDVTSDVKIENAVEMVKLSIPTREGLWAVVNNADFIGKMGPTTWFTRYDYEETLAVNLYGVICVTKAFLPLLIPAKGRVVNMSSICGRFAMVGSSPYNVSKYGVEAFTDTLRRELLVLGMKVSIIEPGLLGTTLSQDEWQYRVATKFAIGRSPPKNRPKSPIRVIQTVLNGMKFPKKKFATDDLNNVVDAYVDALTARFPKERYLVGNDVNFIYRLLWNLPEWITDIAVLKWMCKERERPKWGTDSEDIKYYNPIETWGNYRDYK